MNLNSANQFYADEVGSMSSLTLPSLAPNFPEVFDLTSPCMLLSQKREIPMPPTADPHLLQSMDNEQELQEEMKEHGYGDDVLKKTTMPLADSDEKVSDEVSVAYLGTMKPDYEDEPSRTPIPVKADASSPEVVDLITPKVGEARRSTAAELTRAVARAKHRDATEQALALWVPPTAASASSAEAGTSGGDPSPAMQHSQQHHGHTSSTAPTLPTVINYYHIVNHHNHHTINNTLNYTPQQPPWPVCQHHQLPRRVAGNRAKHPGREYVWCSVCRRAIYL